MAPPDTSRPLFRPLIAGGAAALWVWAFMRLGSEVLEGDTDALDRAILRTAQSLRAGHPWMVDMMRDLSGLGSTAVLALFTVVTMGYLMVARARQVAWLLATAVVLGSAAVSLLKAWFGRPRPEAGFAELVVPGMSFPSGHAAMSAIVFLTLGALLVSTRTRAPEQLYILAAATLMTLLVGTSRIVLGVHWTTDVVAGWAFGAAWALVWLLLGQRLARGTPPSNPGTGAPGQPITGGDRSPSRTHTP